MRIPSTLGRITALTALFVVSAISTAVAAPETVTLTAGSGATVAATSRGYLLTSSYSLACPGSASTDSCTVATTITALVQPVGARARVATIATSSMTVPGGRSRRVIARLNPVGAAELRRAGRISARLAVSGTIATGNGSPTGSTFSRQQVLGIPPLVLTDSTRLTSVKLAPGQRLVLRLGGESASTGYAWKFEALASSAALRRVSSRSIVDPSCSPGTAGCFSTREVVYVGRPGGGTTRISTGLYGPQPMTDATVRITLRVTTQALEALPKVVRNSANGSTVAVSFRQPLVVSLSGASASTGFAWRVLEDSIKPVASVDVPADCAIGMTGCASSSEFTFMDFGSARISLGLFGPGTTTPQETFTIRAMAPVA